jgi:hypothetical protein
MNRYPSRLTSAVRRSLLVLAASAGLATITETAFALGGNHSEPFIQARWAPHVTHEPAPEEAS